jgi:metallo-beta-lactamase class B
MKIRALAFGLIALLGCTSAAPVERLASDPVIDAAQGAPLDETSAQWNRAIEPFNVVGNIYYVGVEGVSSYLITTPNGHVIIDGAFAQSAPQIIANVGALGFDIRDVKYLLNTHAHNDHAGGLAALQRASGARMVASAGDREALERGYVGYGPSADWRFPPIRVDRIVGDEDTLELGGVVLTAHMTPGHTMGCTSWSIDVTGADGAPHTAFFHCSATVAGNSLAPEAYPGIVANYRTTFERVRGLSADVLLGNHSGFFDLHGKRARQVAGDANAFVDAEELQRFNANLEQAFETELARQVRGGEQSRG